MAICVLAIAVDDRPRLRGLLGKIRKEHGYLIYGTIVHRRGTGDWSICHHRLHTGGGGVWVVAHYTVDVCHRAQFDALPEKRRKYERLAQCGFQKRRCGTVQVV